VLRTNRMTPPTIKPSTISHKTGFSDCRPEKADWAQCRVDWSAVRPLPDIALIGKRGFESKCVAFWSTTQNGVRADHWKFGDTPRVNGLTKSNVDAIAAYVRALRFSGTRLPFR
jgi:hypothetical protein